jgi:phosphatidylinositol alpha-1,6-mannosyltransferase
VVRRVPTARLLVVGSGPEENTLRRAAREHGVSDHVVFTGAVSERDKVSYYNLADVFVSPSSLEGFGLSVAEAMSCGLPVVVARRGALPELVGDGPGAVVCEPAAVEQFADGLVGYLQSPERRAAGGEANRARVETSFRWERTAREVIAVYEEAVARWRGSVSARQGTR